MTKKPCNLGKNQCQTRENVQNYSKFEDVLNISTSRQFQCFYGSKLVIFERFLEAHSVAYFLTWRRLCSLYLPVLRLVIYSVHFTSHEVVQLEPNALSTMSPSADDDIESMHLVLSVWTAQFFVIGSFNHIRKYKHLFSQH